MNKRYRQSIRMLRSNGQVPVHFYLFLVITAFGDRRTFDGNTYVLSNSKLIKRIYAIFAAFFVLTFVLISSDWIYVPVAFGAVGGLLVVLFGVAKLECIEASDDQQ